MMAGSSLRVLQFDDHWIADKYCISRTDLCFVYCLGLAEHWRFDGDSELPRKTETNTNTPRPCKITELWAMSRLIRSLRDVFWLGAGLFFTRHVRLKKVLGCNAIGDIIGTPHGEIRDNRKTIRIPKIVTTPLLPSGFSTQIAVAPTLLEILLFLFCKTREPAAETSPMPKLARLSKVLFLVGLICFFPSRSTVLSSLCSVLM